MSGDPRKLLQGLRVPVVGAPMFLVSGPELVIEQCKAGILGAFPALNARPQELLETWLTQIEDALAKHRRESPGAIAAQAMGCDAAYMGTRFIATKESLAVERYKEMLVESNAEDIVYTPFFSGVAGSYLKPSIRAAGLDPDNLPVQTEEKLKYRSRDERPKTWKEIWGAGQGVGNVESIMPAGALVERIVQEYEAAKGRLGCKHV